MSIVVNGTTIPENVANVLNVNGTNITSVICNGVTVWTQSLFSATWSGGNSTTTYYSLQTSGSLCRIAGGTTAAWSTGEWLTMNKSGAFTAGTSTSISPEGDYNRIHAGTNAGLPNQMLIVFVTNYTAPSKVSFNIGSGFTGSSIATYSNYTMGLNTSGGLIRMETNTWGNGNWLTLS